MQPKKILMTLGNFEIEPPLSRTEEKYLRAIIEYAWETREIQEIRGFFQCRNRIAVLPNGRVVFLGVEENERDKEDTDLL